MIPQNIHRKHVLKAIKHIDHYGVPMGRGSRKFHLVYSGSLYPPKYALALANRFANGADLEPSEFGGGNETNSVLVALGFEIKRHGEFTALSKFHRVERQRVTHNERCSECKNTLIEMLRRLYGTVKIDHKIDAPARIEGYRGTPIFGELNKIYLSLINYRNNDDFVRLNSLHRCDLFVPDPGFIVEFDESQHFSQARNIALSHYPPSLLLGFDIEEWKNLCNKIDSKDHDPVYRNEQRAWYDTLRDFLPWTKNMLPTIRVPMGSVAWCELDTESDLQVLVGMLNLPPRSSLVKNLPPVRQKQRPLIVGAVVIQGNENTSTHDRLYLLECALRRASELEIAPDLFVLPAGYFSTRLSGMRRAETLGQKVREVVRRIVPESVVCVGVDGRNDKDQIAIAVSKNGIIAAARKFFPTDDEKGYIEVAESPFTGEMGLPRMFSVMGRQVYLAVCYDGFGIRKMQLNNPGVDIVVDLAHGFYNRGEGGSGDVYFAKHGFAGTSKQWRCPVVGSATFFGRRIPPNWPSFVLWNQGRKGTKEWSYADNPLASDYTFTTQFGGEQAEVRVSQLM